MRGERPRVILVTDRAFGDDGIERTVRFAGAVLSSALCVQLRDRVRSRTSLRLFAARLRMVTRSVGASFVLNGDPGVARDVGADGVHLGRDAPSVAEARAILGAAAWISVSAHTDADVARARSDGAAAVLVSPIFPTRPPSPYAPSKSPRGLAALRSARVVAGPALAVYGLGGVTVANAGACARAGADGVAVLRELLASDDPRRAARLLGDATARRW
jgi:thiamine-phosphate pyrophosphorylase